LSVDIFNLTTALTDFIKEQWSVIQYWCIKTMEIMKEWQLRVWINVWYSLLYWGHKWPYCTTPSWHMRIQNKWNDNWQGKADVLKEKPTPVPPFTLNSTWTAPGLNLGLHSGKLVNNHQSYGMDMVQESVQMGGKFQMLEDKGCWRQIFVAVINQHVLRLNRSISITRTTE
jgi:hypothetical protein